MNENNVYSADDGSRKSNIKNDVSCERKVGEQQQKKMKSRKSTRATWCSIANYSPTSVAYGYFFHLLFSCVLLLFSLFQLRVNAFLAARDVMTDQRDWKDVKKLSTLTYLEGRQSCYVRCLAKPRCVCTARKASQAIWMVCTTPSQIGETLFHAFVLACEEDRFRIYHHSDFHFRRTQRAATLSMATLQREYVRWHSRVDCWVDWRSAMSSGTLVMCDDAVEGIHIETSETKTSSMIYRNEWFFHITRIDDLFNCSWTLNLAQANSCNLSLHIFFSYIPTSQTFQSAVVDLRSPHQTSRESERCASDEIEREGISRSTQDAECRSRWFSYSISFHFGVGQWRRNVFSAFEMSFFYINFGECFFLCCWSRSVDGSWRSWKKREREYIEYQLMSEHFFPL